MKVIRHSFTISFGPHQGCQLAHVLCLTKQGLQLYCFCIVNLYRIAITEHLLNLMRSYTVLITFTRPYYDCR